MPRPPLPSATFQPLASLSSFLLLQGGWASHACHRAPGQIQPSFLQAQACQDEEGQGTMPAWLQAAWRQPNSACQGASACRHRHRAAIVTPSRPVSQGKGWERLPDRVPHVGAFSSGRRRWGGVRLPPCLGLIGHAQSRLTSRN